LKIIAKKFRMSYNGLLKQNFRLIFRKANSKPTKLNTSVILLIRKKESL
jgi:hypothetical protein